jgi:predicted Zn finger-like uncharacterized protein
MPTMTSCPSCSKQLKVPDELIGRQVKCPACGTTFTAGVAAPAPIVAPAPVQAAPSAPGGEFSPGFPTPPKTATGLIAPGIILLLVSLLNLGIAGYWFFTYSEVQKHPEEVKKVLAQMREERTKGMPEDQKQKFNEIVDWFETNILSLYLGLTLLAVAQAVLTLPGAIQMIRSRRGGLGWLAAFMNVLPISCCCIGGAPVSIWAMIALYKAGKA